MPRLPRLLTLALILALTALACGDDASSPAATSADADTHDADTHDADTHDADTHDADTHDADTHDADADPDAAAPDPDAPPETPDAEDAPDADTSQDAATDTPDPDLPLPDQPTGLGPATRVTAIDAPSTPSEGRQLGCHVLGPSVGSGLSNLLFLSGGLTQYTRPNASGAIPLHLLYALDGWTPGLPATALASAPLTLTVYYGRLNPDGRTTPHPDSFTDADPTLPPRFTSPDTRVTPRGWLETPPRPFTLTTPVFGDLLIDIHLHHTTLQGQLLVDGPGFAIPAGVLSGYLRRDDLLRVLLTFQAACASDQPPALCNVVGDIFAPDIPPEQLLQQAQGFIGGFDVHIDPDGPQNPFPCQPARDLPCNAVGVCLTFASQGAALHPR